MTFRAHPEPMNLIALPIIHTATRRAVTGARSGDRVLPAPRTRRRRP
jgi:hypothetical protein